MRNFLHLIIFMTIATCVMASAYGQLTKYYTVPAENKADKVDLYVHTSMSKCYIKPGQDKYLLTLYGNPDQENYTLSMGNTLDAEEKTMNIDVDVQRNSKIGWENNVVSQKFNLGYQDNLWKIYLSKNIAYQFNFNLGLGDTDVNLSGLSVEQVDLNSAGGNVLIHFDDVKNPNPKEMETFDIKVDMGELHIKGISLSRAKSINLEVDFGKMYLDFSDPPLISQHIRGSVGAGKLIIQLPDSSVPVKTVIHDSWLCNVDLSNDFKSKKKGVFVNDAYQNKKDSRRSLYFFLDVSVGKITFIEK